MDLGTGTIPPRNTAGFMFIGCTAGIEGGRGGGGIVRPFPGPPISPTDLNDANSEAASVPKGCGGGGGGIGICDICGICGI